MTTLWDPVDDAVDTPDGYDARLARLHEEIDALEEELSAGSARLALLRRQTEVLERAARGRGRRLVIEARGAADRAGAPGSR